MNEEISESYYEAIGKEIIAFKQGANIFSWNGPIRLDCQRNPSRWKEVVDIIKQSIPKNANGIYAIFKEDLCLYIGVGKPIWVRIKSHYYATQGQEKNKRWGTFFMKYDTNLKVYWTEFGDVNLIGTKSRQLVEAILHEKHKPVFSHQVTK